MTKSDNATYLGFDYGIKQIGVASAQSVTAQASPLRILRASDGIPDWHEIEALLNEWQPQLLIVGLPLNMDGSESPMSSRAKKFSQRLAGRYGLPVKLVDERLSSFEARQQILEKSSGEQRSKRRLPAKDKIDAEAAAVILQSWLDQQYSDQ